jgi:hypothetical protein
MYRLSSPQIIANIIKIILDTYILYLQCNWHNIHRRHLHKLSALDTPRPPSGSRPGTRISRPPIFPCTNVVFSFSDVVFEFCVNAVGSNILDCAITCSFIKKCTILTLLT